MFTKLSSNAVRTKRHIRIRQTISGTAECPRLNVFRSNTHIYVQLIDDVAGVTLASASSLQLKIENGGNVAAAKQVGLAIGKLAAEKNITKVVFDRGGYLYHGRVKAVADGAREAGLQF